MMRNESAAGLHRIMLDEEELAFLRFTCDLSVEDESPLPPIPPLDEGSRVERAAARLSGRGLLERRTLRADRELVRRLLIVSQPDARIVVTELRAGKKTYLSDVYERAGAHVKHRTVDGSHELGAPKDLDQVLDEVMGFFAVRRSTGDFVDLTLSVSEYLAFSILARDLFERKRAAIEAETQRTLTRSADATTARNPIEEPSLADELDEGTPIRVMLRRFERGKPPKRAEPEQGLADALGLLKAKGIVMERHDRHVLRPYLQDLAVGLADRRRLVVARFDFGEEDWLARDATFIAVPGSIFLIRATKESNLRIVELDGPALGQALRSVVCPLEGAMRSR